MFLCGKLGIDNYNLTAKNKSLEDELKSLSDDDKYICNTQKAKIIATEVSHDTTWDANISKKTEDTTVTPVQTTTNLDENSETEVDDTQTVTPETEEKPTDESNVDDTTSSPEEESQVPNVPVVDTPQDNNDEGSKTPTSDNPDNIGVINTPDEQSNAEAQGKAIVTISFNFNSK